MRKLLQINTVGNCTSTGKIAEGIGVVAQNYGWEVYSAFGRNPRNSKMTTYHLCSNAENLFNVMWCRMFDCDSPISKIATKKLINLMEEIQPDVIQIHNLHGYYLNVAMLFDYLGTIKTPVVWTLHDCWSFTGHCAYPKECTKWMDRCNCCPQKRMYPSSLLFDNSVKNFYQKCNIAKLNNIIFVPVSHWLNTMLKKSIYSKHLSYVIHNGIDLQKFKPIESNLILNQYGLLNSTYILGVSNVWTDDKGYRDFFEIRKFFPEEIKIVLVGACKSQCEQLARNNIIGIPKTENTEALAALYSNAKVFVSPTYYDNYPTVILEAIACGVPVVCYNTGGCIEAVHDSIGIVVDRGNVESMITEISNIIYGRKKILKQDCVSYANLNFDQDKKFKEYLDIYEMLV